MKILLIHPHDIYSLQEPWTVRIVSIAKELKKAGYEIKLIYFPLNWHAGIQPLEIEGIPTIALSRRTGPFVLLKNIAKLYRISEWADIIHFQKCFHWASIPALLAAFLKNKPVHYDWDDWEEKIFIASNERPFLPIVIFLRILEKYIPKLADTISVSSETLKQLCIDFGIRNERVYLAPVGADLVKFNPNIPPGGIKKVYGIEGPLIFYHGQLHGAQYAKIFIEVAKYIQDNYNKQVKFMIAGGGGCLNGLKLCAKKFNLKNLIFAGYIPHDIIPQYIASSDICLAPFDDNDITRCKSSLKIVEYLASGKPIITSPVGEVRSMIDDAGVLIKAIDSQSLGIALISLLDNVELRERLSKLARQRAEKEYNWAITAKKLKNAYNMAICLKQK